MKNEPSTELNLQKYFESAHFETSATNLGQCPNDGGVEVAFAGRSNAGKSSAINCLCNKKKLARVSKTPGRTQLLNFFTLNEKQRLVDLPGYGYAKVSLSKKLIWQKNLMAYLERREALKGLILVMDARHPLQPFDHSMLEWTKKYQVLCHILLTKSDKLKRGAAKQTLKQIESTCIDSSRVSVQLFSSINGEGLNTARNTISNWLNIYQ